MVKFTIILNGIRDFYGNNSGNTSYVEESRYNDWLANVDQNGNQTYNPNDTEGIKGTLKRKFGISLLLTLQIN